MSDNIKTVLRDRRLIQVKENEDGTFTEYVQIAGADEGLEVAPAAATFSTKTAAIAQNQSLSDAVDLAGLTVVGIVMPAAWDLAALTFQGSVDGTTYNNLYDEYGAEVTVTAAASRAIAVLPNSALLGFRYIKVRSGTAASAVAQTAARTITLSVRPV